VTVGMAFFNTLERIPQLKGKMLRYGQTLMSQGLYVVWSCTCCARDPSRVEHTGDWAKFFAPERPIFHTPHKDGDKLHEKMRRFI
jgi:hypothetical protein